MMGFIQSNLKCRRPSRFVELRPGTKVCRLHLGMISTDAVGSKPCPEHRGEVIRGVLVFFRTGCLLSTKVDGAHIVSRVEIPRIVNPPQKAEETATSGFEELQNFLRLFMSFLGY